MLFRLSKLRPAEIDDDGRARPRAYDCSGLVEDAYRHAGISLPRTTYDLIGVGTPVPRSEVREGDLVLSNFSAPGRPAYRAGLAGSS